MKRETEFTKCNSRMSEYKINLIQVIHCPLIECGILYVIFNDIFFQINFSVHLRFVGELNHLLQTIELNTVEIVGSENDEFAAVIYLKLWFDSMMRAHYNKI